MECRWILRTKLDTNTCYAGIIHAFLKVHFSDTINLRHCQHPPNYLPRDWRYKGRFLWGCCNGLLYLQKQGILLCNFRESYLAIPGKTSLQQTTPWASKFRLQASMSTPECF